MAACASCSDQESSITCVGEGHRLGWEDSDCWDSKKMLVVQSPPQNRLTALSPPQGASHTASELKLQAVARAEVMLLQLNFVSWHCRLLSGSSNARPQ
jgi:hypothetical protein